MVELSATQNPLFFTGDLGFMALEPLQKALGPRFINAGVAEQNMVSVAAGAASLGEQCWAYSIAPFIYARPFEQVRNDVCLHDLNVKLVGNGGGYGYGVMGGTHHALEDYGVLCSLPNMRAFVPAFSDDVAPIVARMTADVHPGYLRLGRCEKPAGWVLPDYAPWRRLLSGNNGVLLAAGPGAGGLLAAAAALAESARPEIWVVTELPLQVATIPRSFLDRVNNSRALSVWEEHVAGGGVGQMLAVRLLEHGVYPKQFHHFHARGYLSGRYGSQSFHRVESGLDPAFVMSVVTAKADA
jgi:transketolase